MEYIDVHCHLLPGVDDGSQDMDEAMEMLKIAEKNGITDAIVTPHYKQGRVGTPRKVIGEMIREVEKYARLSGLSIRLYPGTEIYYSSSVGEKLDSGWLSSMNDTEYVLVVFDPQEPFSYLRNAVDDLFGLGYHPILAHVERYRCMLGNVDNVKALRDFGCKIQVNAGSIIGDSGFKVKQFVKKLLKEELIDYVGTDAHDVKSRSPELTKCVDVIRKYCDSEYADDILFKNAKTDFFRNELPGSNTN